MDPAVRRLLVRRAAAGAALEILDPEALRSGDLAAAVVQAIDELAASGATAADLESSDDPRLRDICRLWSDHDDGGRRHAEAVELLGDRAGKIDGTLAVVDGSESRGEALVIRSLPNLTLAVVCARPDTDEHRQ
jgi:hypothetical protein